MENIMELIKDEATMERIIKIVDGLWNGTVILATESQTNNLVCRIGEGQFYFIDDEDITLTPEEVKCSYDVFTIAQMILTAMIDLEDEEYTDYCDILGF